MAQVKIYALRTSLDGKRAQLSRAIHECVMNVLGLPEGKKAHRFFPLEPQDLIAPSDRSESYTILEIQMMSGRTRETKKRFINALFDQVASDVGIAKQDLEICIIESPPENWGFRGMTGDEANLNYKVNV